MALPKEYVVKIDEAVINNNSHGTTKEVFPLQINKGEVVYRQAFFLPVDSFGSEKEMLDWLKKFQPQYGKPFMILGPSIDKNDLFLNGKLTEQSNTNGFEVWCQTLHQPGITREGAV